MPSPPLRPCLEREGCVMGFVKTREEMARIRAVLSNPRFVNAEMLQVEFLTETATVRRILPPGLEPTERPLVTAMVGRWQSNCVGDYEGGSISVAARQGDIEAGYNLAMYMTTDAAIIFGRELFGEAKKQASVGWNRSGSRMCGWIERHGVRLIEIKADLGPDLGPTKTRGLQFNIKALPATNGEGMEGDAILALAEFDTDVKVSRVGTGLVKLRGTRVDPLDEIEVKEVVRATYIEGNLDSHARNIGKIPAAEFLPYYYGRVDDWTELSTEETLATL